MTGRRKATAGMLLTALGLVLSQRAVPAGQDAADKIDDAAARAQHITQFVQIGKAFHNYHGVHKHFPLHAIYSKDGKTPLLSWRVAILPYLEQEALYKEFKLDEPWNSPHNRRLIAKMPKVFAMPGSPAGTKGRTSDRTASAAISQNPVPAAPRKAGRPVARGTTSARASRQTMPT